MMKKKIKIKAHTFSFFVYKALLKNEGMTYNQFHIKLQAMTYKRYKIKISNPTLKRIIDELIAKKLVKKILIKRLKNNSYKLYAIRKEIHCGCCGAKLKC